jgi:hypothetical protein
VKRNAKKSLGRKLLSWTLALVMMVGMVPATFATPASAAEIDGGAITEWEANALLAASLTPELIDYLKISQWNGNLPVITGGATPIIDMTDLINAD